MFSYPAFLLGHGTAGWQVPIRDIAWVTGIIGLVLAWIAAGSYVPVAREALAEGRSGKGDGTGKADGDGAGAPAEEVGR
jgi:hypothetical protein